MSKYTEIQNNPNYFYRVTYKNTYLFKTPDHISNKPLELHTWQSLVNLLPNHTILLEQDVNPKCGTFKINLSYFKQSGKYAMEGSFKSTRIWAYDIFDDVKEMQKDGCLPGLTKNGGKEFYIHIDSNLHPNMYPALIMPLEIVNV